MKHMQLLKKHDSLVAKTNRIFYICQVFNLLCSIVFETAVVIEIPPFEKYFLSNEICEVLFHDAKIYTV